MSRSFFKGPLFNPFIQLKQKKKNTYKEITLLNSNYTILPSYINLTFKIYNGKNFSKIKVKEKMVGYKFCEFIKTRKEFKYKK